jgi:hypothetical protein
MKNRSNTFFIILMACILALTFSACTENREPIPSEDGNEGTAVETVAGEAGGEEGGEKTPDPETFSVEDIIIDGHLNSHEYIFSLKDETTGMEVYWANDEQHIYIGIITDSTGWTSIGFDPESAMKGANIIFMAIDDQGIVIRDDFGTSTFSHSSDEDLGGSFDIEEYAGKPDGDVAVYEFKIMMDTGDEFDSVLVPGEEYKVILATNSGGVNFDSKHTKKSSSQIKLN